jgi:hypothetical protein
MDREPRRLYLPFTMAREQPVVDLRAAPPAHVRGATFAHARELTPGHTLALLVAQEPSLLMHSVNLQLLGNLAWTAAPVEGGWRIEVRLRLDAPAEDVLDLLEREHRRLDRLMAGLLQAANHGDAAAIGPAFTEFAVLLRHHVGFENGRLAPLCAGHEPRTPDAPTAIMLREHEEILRQLAVLEDSVAAGEREEIGAFVAILSGTLAKH